MKGKVEKLECITMLLIIVNENAYLGWNYLVEIILAISTTTPLPQTLGKLKCN